MDSKDSAVDRRPETPVPHLPHGQPNWRGRSVRLLALLVAVLIFGGSALAQDATPPTPSPTASADAASATGAEAEWIPGSAWLLPIDNMVSWPPEPITWIIVICSVVAVTLIIQAFLRARRAVLLPEESTAEIERLINEKQYRELIDFTETDDSFVSQSLNPALKRAPGFADMREALETSVADQTAEEFRRLEYINILANVGPLLGLLGTVIGIMDAFLEMRKAGGTADVSALAGGISTALGTTMLGLMLAIPALVAYGILRNRVDRLTTEGALLSEEFLLMIKPDNRGGGATAPAPRPVAAPRPRPTPAKAPARQAAPTPAPTPTPTSAR